MLELQNKFTDGAPLKIRLDKLLVDRGLVGSLANARALILAGKVFVDGQKAEKAGLSLGEDVNIRLAAADCKFVGRGGLKLEKALSHWKIDVRGKVCLDVGASTGGFTDCLLQHGAASVVAVDTGYGQFDFGLRQDARVRLLEKTNARHITHEQLGMDVDFIAMDVSFISATAVLPAVIKAGFGAAVSNKQIVVLVKPQFEVRREDVEKGGIVRNAEAQKQSVEKVRKALLELGAKETAVIDSPILGMEGNREFLLHGKF